jgi:hypothetical protein
VLMLELVEKVPTIRSRSFFQLHRDAICLAIPMLQVHIPTSFPLTPPPLANVSGQRPVSRLTI